MSDFIHPDLHLFQRLVEFSSFSAAALQLGVQQPALTKLLGRLEERHGHKLVLRGQRGFTLTHEGEVLLERLKRLQATWQTDQEKTPRRVTLAAHESLAQVYLPTLLPLLVEAYPATDFTITQAPSSDVSRRVSAGEWDLGLVINPLKNADLLFRQVGEEFVGLWGKTSKVGEVILVHPDMLMVGRLMRHLPEGRIITVPNYQTIASIVAEKEGWVGLLPHPVAKLSGLTLHARVFDVKLNLIARKDKFPLEFFRKVGELAKISAERVNEA